VCPGWDKIVLAVWNDIKRLKLNNIKIVSQLPGGIKNNIDVDKLIGGYKVKVGKLGGSGGWNVLPTFFEDVGFLDLRKLQNISKKHDQLYWLKLDENTKGREYILGVPVKLYVHTGFMCGSVCNVLASNQKDKDIKFIKQEQYIESFKFDEFYQMIKNSSEYNHW
jgi:hypothetical protein